MTIHLQEYKSNIILHNMAFNYFKEFQLLKPNSYYCIYITWKFSNGLVENIVSPTLN
jgi:hypothetical protein